MPLEEAQSRSTNPPSNWRDLLPGPCRHPFPLALCTLPYCFTRDPSRQSKGPPAAQSMRQAARMMPSECSVGGTSCQSGYWAPCTRPLGLAAGEAAPLNDGVGGARLGSSTPCSRCRGSRICCRGAAPADPLEEGGAVGGDGGRGRGPLELGALFHRPGQHGCVLLGVPAVLEGIARACTRRQGAHTRAQYPAALHTRATPLPFSFRTSYILFLDGRGPLTTSDQDVHLLTC